ncbi:radical SAM protein [uncultured Alistipes sp.]|jgi:arylsulfatase regulator|uniref:radical SAM/SPASM domain-containing protein n=1 Tax=uncultured Alistipes sp. TaxID=538949 RepID=UPI0025CBFD25|nr:radical SAM protein [uncultured Alistipes sp.]
MTVSKYTFLFDVKKQEFYAYNTLSNALIEVDEESYTLLRNTAPGADVSELDKELQEVLREQNILTESDEDDYLKYKSYLMRLRSQRTSMHLTLAPTMDCCFRCHYCFEKYKEKNYMTPEVMDAIVRYVASLPELKSIKITWFGGEPLMAVPQMEEFCDKLSATWNKPVSSNIITTGYHIDENAIRVMKKTGVSQAQITLDGMKQTHNSVKHLPDGEDVFEKVLGNIELLNDLAPGINVVIRVNLTQENAHEYGQLHQLYRERFKDRKNIAIAPAFVLDRGASNCDACEIQSSLFNHKGRSDFILDLAKKGYDSPYIRYPQRFFNECAIRNDMAIAFDPEGFAYKCWEVIGNKEYAIGKLNPAGELTEINEKILNRQLFGADPIDDPKCSKCKYLPVCNGGCPIQRIENKFEKGANSTCTHYKGYMADFLRLHLARKKSRKRR